MATRTQKAKAKAQAKAPEGKPAPKGAKAKAPKGSKPSSKKGRKGGKQDPVVFDEVTGWPEALDTVRAKQPSFMERLRLRRAEKAVAREEERLRREAERKLAEARRRQVEEEQRVLREAQEEKERVAREAAGKEAEAQRVAEERKAKAAATRAANKAAKEEADRAAAAEAERKAAEEEAAKEQRAAERARKREELEAEERRLAAEQAERDAEAEVEARRLAANKKLAEEARKAEKAQAKELEPDLEFQEASKPVKESDALVPAKGAASAASAADAQADLVAAELAKRRSKPIVVVGDLPEPPKIPKAPLRAGETFEPPAAVAPPPPSASRTGESQPTDKFGFSIPEAFLLLANGGGWDERAEQNREGSFGGALAGAMVLELLMRGQVLVQRDRIVLTGEPTDDEALARIVSSLRRIREKKGDLTSLQQMGQLAKANRELLTPFKQRLADKGLATYGSRKHLGLFHRSWVEIADEGAQERLQNRLRRAIAGGGTPEAASILLLGLLDATGLFATVVPDEAAEYNRKRLNGLLGGRDIMGYKVDPQLKALQEMATRAILNNVRVMTVRG